MDDRAANRFDLSFSARYEAAEPIFRGISPPWQAPTDTHLPHRRRPDGFETQPLAREETWGIDKSLISEKKGSYDGIGNRNPTSAPYDDVHFGHLRSKRESSGRFLMFGLLRWAGTAALSGLYYLAIRLHQNRTLSQGQKSAFDAIIVGISIALGLNIAASLREIAIYMRWWFLGKKQIHIREVSNLVTKS